MNSDLAYCLERFIEDQIHLIDDNLETMTDNEHTEYRRIKQLKVVQQAQKITETNKGTHDEDERIVQRFIQSLFDVAEIDTTGNIEYYRRMLRTEFNEKTNECSQYVVRLRNLAQPILGSEDFVSKCKETMNRLNATQKTEESYNDLCRIIERSDSKSIVNNIQNWWEQRYGSSLIEIIHLNKRFNPGVGNNQIALIPSRGGMIGYAKKILSIGDEEPLLAAQKHELICRFVRQIQSIDEENRQDYNENDLIDQLNSNEVDGAIDYAVNWLEKRDAKRSHKQEETSYDALWEETKTLFDCQRIARESKKLALATLLRRLAIGSENIEQFDQKLEITLEKQRQGVALPVMIGDIKELSVDKLPISIRLEGANIDEWLKNSNGIQNEFSSSLCQAFRIPDKSIRITEVKYGSVIIFGYVAPPYGKDVVDSLNGVAPDSPVRIKAVRKCCLAVRGTIQSITIGDCGLSIDHKLMDSMWNRIYRWSNQNRSEGQYWERPLDRGGKPYFCPSGWQRFGVKVAENDEAFDACWGNWYLGYHGTEGEHATDILISGLRVSTRGCYFEKGIPRIYLSPSIEYCAHSRYAKPWIKTERDGKTRWLQLVFQCRVNPEAIKKYKAETLLHPRHKNDVKIDPNFDNKDLEWVIPGNQGCQYMNRDIICYGLMMRVSDVDPKYLPSSSWWKYC